MEGAPSTHLLKPAAAWPHSAHNEAVVMTLAHAAGLIDRAVWVEDVQGTAVLVAERYAARCVTEKSPASIRRTCARPQGYARLTSTT